LLRINCAHEIEFERRNYFNFFSLGGNMDPHPNFWFTTYTTDWIPSLRMTGVSR
jgi:hypothetical protein